MPVLAFLFIKDVKHDVDASGEPTKSIWMRAYTPVIKGVLRSKWTALGVVAISGVLFFASLALVPLLPTQFINAGSEKILQVSVAPPTGATSEAVLARAIEAEGIVRADPDVELVQTSIPGEGDTSFQTIIAAQSGRPANSATLTIRLDPAVDLAAKTTEIATALAAIKTDGYDVQVSEAAGFASNGLNIIVSSPDPTLVASTTESVVAALANQTGIANLKSDLVKAHARDPGHRRSRQGDRRRPHRGAGRNEVRTVLTPTTATQVTFQPGRPIDIVVQVDPESVTSVEALGALPVGTVVKVPLSQIATVEQADVQGSITRIDQAPSSSISAEITSKDTGAVSKASRRDRRPDGRRARSRPV